MRIFKATSLVTMGAIAASLPLASAQEDFFARDRHTSVQERQQPEFDPEPIRLGGLLLDSSIAAGISSNDNVFAQPTGEESDILITLNPTAQLRTNWSIHELSAGLDLQVRKYNDFDIEDATDIRANVGGRLDVTREITLSGRVYANEIYETRRAITSQQGLDGPIEYDVLGTQLEAQFQRSRISARATLTLDNIDYIDGSLLSNGLVVDQDFRDNVARRLQTRVSYALSPDVAIFGQAEVGSRDYDTTFDGLGNEVNRDSTTYAAQGGVNFELPSLFRGDIAVGYLKDKKDGIGFGDVSGLAIDGRLEWFPTELTTLTLDASRRSADPGLLASPSAINTSFGVRADHELRRNIVLYGRVGRTSTDFEDFAREDEVANLGFGGIYKMSKHVHIDAFYDYFNRDSDFAPDEFSQNLLGIRLRFFP
ncbi:MAG: outer membrane beta-barrel protein [Hyphomonadaceae bacterium]